MNIVLFEPNEIGERLTQTDARARHIIDVLRCKAGDRFDAGIVDGPRGNATIDALTPGGLELSFTWGDEPAPLDDITLIAGLPRPQTARKVLEEATSLGLEAMHFVITEKGDPGYASSRLWSTGEWRRHVIAGAAQAFTTRLPVVTNGRTLASVIGELPDGGTRLALDNYEATSSLGSTAAALPLAIALGPERGWSAAERDLLRREGFTLVHLGERVLRSETAAVAALAIARSKLGLI